jgi:TolA-binding protein
MKHYVYALAAAMVGAGCAGSSMQMQGSEQELLPQVDVVQVKENSNKALRIAQEAKLKADNVNSKLVEMDHRLTHIDDKASRVTIAKIEEIETQLSLIVEAVKDLQVQIDALEAAPRVSAPQKKKAAKPSGFSPSRAYGILNPSDVYFLYNQGLRTYDKGQFKEAKNLFSEVIAEYPESIYTDKAQYWIGECYYAMQEYAKAVASFKKVRDIAGCEKNDDAHFQLAKALSKMGHNSEAHNEFKNFLTRFPNSAYVDQARTHIKRLQ